VRRPPEPLARHDHLSQDRLVRKPERTSDARVGRLAECQLDATPYSGLCGTLSLQEAISCANKPIWNHRIQLSVDPLAIAVADGIEARPNIRQGDLWIRQPLQGQRSRIDALDLAGQTVDDSHGNGDRRDNAGHTVARVAPRGT
jgi:hypothetical protein